MGRHKKTDAAQSKSETEAPHKKRVLELSDDGDGDAPVTLKVNSKFAKEFHERNKIAEMKRLSEKYGDSDDDDDDDESAPSEGEDDDGVLAADAAEEFLAMLPKLAAHDPSVTRKEAKYFEKLNAERDSDDDDATTPKPTKASSVAKVTYKDLQRTNILAQMDADAAADEGEDAPDKATLKEAKRRMKGGLSIAEEERRAREEFLRAAQGEDEASSEDGTVRKRAKSAAEREQEENEYKQFLAEQRHTTKDDARLLHQFWIDKTDADPQEKFLRDFIINKAWIDKDGASVPTYDEIVADDGESAVVDEEDSAMDVDEEDAALDELQDTFEHAYNFRFEEPGGTEIVTHVRAQIESARAPDERRKEKRKKRQEKKEREKKQRLDEKNRLQNLKREEITGKLRQLQRVSGMSKDKMAALLDDGEFDATKWDAQMDAVFDDAYYNDVEFEKPDFGDGAGAAEDGEDAEAVTPNWEKEARRVVERVKKSAPHNESVQEEAQELEKALEDYYKLDYEDLVGDMPVRFKYTRVEPVSYGLNAVDILLGDDKQLNRFVPLKKLAPYREDQGRVKKSGKARGIKRKRIMPDTDDAAPAHTTAAEKSEQQREEGSEGQPKKKRRRRHKDEAATQ